MATLATDGRPSARPKRENDAMQAQTTAATPLESQDAGSALPSLAVLLLVLLSPLVYDLLRRLWAVFH